MNTRIFRPALSGILAATSLALLGFSMSATADELKFKLSGDMEVPPVTTKATGNGTITVKPDMSVSGTVMTSGLMATMAHIHVGKAGTNGPVAVTLSRSGDNAWMVPEGTKLSEPQYQAYKAGELYVNVHSAENKGGELRGQLMPAKTPMSSGY
ncbi:MAG: CHRD domain-containing protein [Azonexus sp.]